MDYYSTLFASKLNGGGGSAVLINKNINANGTYNASSDNADGYKKVVVDVPNPSAGSISITQNGTYDVTEKASAVVDVPTLTAEPLSVTENGTYTAPVGKAYSPVNVDVSGGNGYGGDGTWSRPMDMPKLDDMDISGGDVAYLTYSATLEQGFADFGINRSSGTATVELGHIENGLFVVEDTDTFSSNGTYKKYFGSQSGGYKVIRVSGSITTLEFRKSDWVNMNGVYRFSNFQGIKEIYGNLPHLTTIGFESIWEIKAVRFGAFKPSTLASKFRYCYGLQSIDAGNWDLSSCTSMAYAFNDCRSLRKIDTSGWDTKNVTTIQCAFLNCGVAEMDASSWDMAKVTTTQQAFQGTALLKITMPTTLPKVSASTFNVNDAGQILEYHFKSTSVPPLDNTNAFLGIKSQAKIYVPAASLSDYQSASNWSTYANYMVGE